MDNTTAHSTNDYDSEILKTIPYYNNFHNETINLIKSYNANPFLWLDTGCGTGSLVANALEHFKNTVFYLTDPAVSMTNASKDKLLSTRVNILQPVSTQDINTVLNDVRFDVITAIQSHHYLSRDEREKAVSVCFSFLREKGIFINFENIRPDTFEGIKICKNYWKHFQLKQGKTEEKADKHLERFDNEYFPIRVSEHIELYKNIGFSTVEIFWFSYMQCGFYCIK